MNTLVSISEDYSRTTRYIDAIRDGLMQAMMHHKDLVLIGQDIAEYGGVFKITEGFVEKNSERSECTNTPICESCSDRLRAPD